MSDDSLVISKEQAEIKDTVIKGDIVDKDSKDTVATKEDVDSTTKLVRNLGATNLLEEGQKLQVPIEAQKSVENTEELKTVASQRFPVESEKKEIEKVEQGTVSEKSTPRETPREGEKDIEQKVEVPEVTASPEKDKIEEKLEETPGKTETLTTEENTVKQCENQSEDGQRGEIFSITGQKGVRVSRHRDQVTVFPSGCMGVPCDKEDEIASNNRGRRFLRASDVQERDSGHLEGCPRRRPPSASVRHAQQTRNPLTGEGYQEADFICGHGKHLQAIGTHDEELNKNEKKIENKIEIPVDSKESNKSKRIPPGGYSTPLW